MILRNKRATPRIHEGHTCFKAKNKAKRALDAFVSENFTCKVESFEPGLFPAALFKFWDHILSLNTDNIYSSELTTSMSKCGKINTYALTCHSDLISLG